LALIPDCVQANPKMEKYYECISERLAGGVPATWDGTYRATIK
jgi:hypothetical protein